MSSPTLFFLKIVLALVGLLYFHNFRISLFISEKALEIFIRISLNFNNILTILSSNLWLNTVILNIFICSLDVSFYSESFPQPSTVWLPPISYMLLLAKILHFSIAPRLYYTHIILYYCFLSHQEKTHSLTLLWFHNRLCSCSFSCELPCLVLVLSALRTSFSTAYKAVS